MANPKSTKAPKSPTSKKNGGKEELAPELRDGNKEPTKRDAKRATQHPQSDDSATRETPARGTHVTTTGGSQNAKKERKKKKQRARQEQEGSNRVGV